MLYCAVNPDDYRKISCCTTAKEMWDKLEVTYEGTDQVREAKLDFLTQEYEMFRMKEGEKIDDMFDRFSKIINDLHALKKTYANKDLVRKILRSLTPEWRSKADAIYESIGVSNVTIDGLRGNLKTYESTILTPSLDEQKKKGIALKATKETVEEVSSDDDNEFGLVIKKFHKFMKKEFERKGRKHDGPLKCYGCGEIGHIKPRCPKGKISKDKPGFKKQRAYISWDGNSGDESTDQEEEEAANLYNPRLARKDICDDLADSLDRIHVEDDEENTGIYTDTQPQSGEIPQATNQGEEENQEEGEEQEEHEEEATELPIAWKANKKHPLDQGRFKVKESGSQGEPAMGGLYHRWEGSLLFSRTPLPIDGYFLTSMVNHGRRKEDKSFEEEGHRRGYELCASTLPVPGRILLGVRVGRGTYSLHHPLRQTSYLSAKSAARVVPSTEGIPQPRQPTQRVGTMNLYDIEIDLATFARVAELPTRGDDIASYGGDDWILNNEAVVIRELGITNLIRHSGAPTIHSAPPEKRLLLYILTRILRPEDSSHTSLFNDDLRAIHAIMHGASINWAKYVMIHMADCSSITTERSLPYAFLVMDLIVSANIHIAGSSTKMTKLWVIADNTFRKKSGNRNSAGTSRARAPAPAPAPAPAWASLQAIADTLNRLTLTVDGMGQYMERMDWTLQRQHHDMRAFFRGINYVPPPIDSTFLGQNYEGEDEEDDSYAPSSSPDEADFEDAVDRDPMDVEDDEDDDDAEDEDADA
ncbi:unnamed protein product [Cuscuta campestris]|uniref:CCHC-type domain-containing protein n=1 Tax=Cuscuta campestris TaxID=132261 RepID=A0A484MVQ9_9ASTE|nr:unnamed protein product [Cuscuta campestris]